MEMVSEVAHDKWRVSTLEMFIDPPSPKRRESWDRGERSLRFSPLGDWRDLVEGETFSAVTSSLQPK